MIPTTKQIVDKMITEICHDFETGILPVPVGSFSELHDYVDANCYGDSESLLDELDADVLDTDENHMKAFNQFCDILNPAIELVDEWLRIGGLKNHNPQRRS